jgi:hypothetical protein
MGRAAYDVMVMGFAKSSTHPFMAVRVQANLLKRIRLMLPVQSSSQK